MSLIELIPDDAATPREPGPTSPPCLRCGSNTIISPGVGPHHQRLDCPQCGSWRWAPKPRISRRPTETGTGAALEPSPPAQGKAPIGFQPTGASDARELAAHGGGQTTLNGEGPSNAQR